MRNYSPCLRHFLKCSILHSISKENEPLCRWLERVVNPSNQAAYHLSGLPTPGRVRAHCRMQKVACRFCRSESW